MTATASLARAGLARRARGRARAGAALLAGLLAANGLAGGVAAQVRDAGDLLAMRFPYQASGADVEQVLSDVTRQVGIVSRLSDGVSGTVTIENGEGRLVDVLDQTASQVRATWWYDGTILHVDSDATLTTLFVDPQGLSVDAINREMEALGLYDPRFELRASSNGSILRVSGPQGYVDQVVSLVTTLNAARRLGVAAAGAQAAGAAGEDGAPDPAGLYLPRVYRGRPSG